MEKGFLDKVEDNATVRIWAETTQREKGDSLTEGHASELWDFTSISVIQNDLREMKEIWGQWDNETKQLFYCNYGDLPYLLSVKVDKYLFRALAQFWSPAYSCFTFGKVDLVPTVEEYTTLLRCPKIQVDKAYSRAASVPPLLKKLMNITGMSEQWVATRIQQKGIYGLVIFPKTLGQIDEVVSDLFDRLSKGVTPIPVILAETFRSLNACRRAREGSYSPLEELVATPRRDDVLEEKWMAILQNLRDEDVEWRAPWLIPDEILYRFGDFDWGLTQCEFSYKGDNYKKKVREMSNAWNRTRRMKILAVGSSMTPEYSQWRDQRVNDNIPMSNPETARSLEEHLQVLPSEIEIIKQDFQKRSLELGKKIEQLEEEKMQLGLDVDVQKLEVDKLRKGNNKAEEDLDSLKTDYKKLRRSMRTAGLGKTLEQWRQEIQEEKKKVDQWEKKFQDTRAREVALEKSLLVCQNEKAGLKV
ncbi:hypothetical protein Gotri_000102 [Gossypium trilobum]|uniref:DUF7745 domain-containing protein n=2 Tax=Gossypium TaxID=3633 RepID=A0A7J9FMK2_9ROSI|nr:hypothetical protein [Gossypium trilobum]